jgi:hypothetical protein
MKTSVKSSSCKEAQKAQKSWSGSGEIPRDADVIDGSSFGLNLRERNIRHGGVDEFEETKGPR